MGSDAMKRHAGFTTFTVTLLLILILVGISLLVGKLMVADRKISVNEVQYRQALALAELGLADGMGRLAADSTWRSAGTPVSTTAGTYLLVASSSSSTITVGTPPDTLDVTPVDLIATATLAGSVGTATVRVQVAGYHLLSAAQAVPLMVAGGTAIGGNFTVVANPNGGGPGVPLSVWSDEAVQGSGSWQTCHQGDFSGGSCSANISDRNDMGPDIKGSDPDFPDDLLFYLFGEPDNSDGWDNMFRNGAIAVPNCASLDAASTGLFIVDTGVDCDLSNVVGSLGAPVVLIVRDGDLTLNGNLVFNGIIFAHTDKSALPPVTPPDVKANGTATVNGSLIANAPLNITSGTFNVKYDQSVLDGIQQGARFQVSKMVPGSWRDW
jgi:hypothetical protein